MLGTGPHRSPGRPLRLAQWFFLALLIVAVTACGGQAVQARTTIGAELTAVEPAIVVEFSVAADDADSWVDWKAVPTNADVAPQVSILLPSGGDGAVGHTLRYKSSGSVGGTVGGFDDSGTFELAVANLADTGPVTVDLTMTAEVNGSDEAPEVTATHSLKDQPASSGQTPNQALDNILTRVGDIGVAPGYQVLEVQASVPADSSSDGLDIAAGIRPDLYSPEGYDLDLANIVAIVDGAQQPLDQPTTIPKAAACAERCVWSFPVATVAEDVFLHLDTGDDNGSVTVTARPPAHSTDAPAGSTAVTVEAASTLTADLGDFVPQRAVSFTVELPDTGDPYDGFFAMGFTLDSRDCDTSGAVVSNGVVVPGFDEFDGHHFVPLAGPVGRPFTVDVVVGESASTAGECANPEAEIGPTDELRYVFVTYGVDEAEAANVTVD